MPWKGQPFGWGVPKPYIDYLPEPQDASMNMLRQLTDQLAEGTFESDSQLKISLNYIESPSNQLAVDLQFQAYNTPCEVTFKADGVPQPDPRNSLARFKLWKYWFKKASPAVRAPSAEITDLPAQLASQPYNYDKNWQEAEQLAAQVPPHSVRELLATMVHPPPIRDAIPAWVWLPRVQLAAAQIATWVELKGNVSIAQSAVAEVALGPVDWTIDAAVIALTQRARSYPTDAPYVADILSRSLNRMPNEGYFSCIEAILQNWRMLPGLPPQDIEELDSILAEFK